MVVVRSQPAKMKFFDVIVMGAGAAGLMCAIEAGKRKRHVLIIDHVNKPGKKILMAGGGRCNFTNLDVTPQNFISHNPHFCISALSRYTQWDFIELVKQYNIPFHEKTLGQLFCDHKSGDILNLLLSECRKHNAEIYLETNILNVEKKSDQLFLLDTTKGKFSCASLVVATGGLSIPTMGASPLGYQIAEQFNIKVWPTRAGLVPLTLRAENKEMFMPLSGVSVDCVVESERKGFQEALLFTHRGLSGPAILQISSYWQPGENIVINLWPHSDLFSALKNAQQQSPQQLLKTFLAQCFPKRLIPLLLDEQILEKNLQSISHKQFEKVAVNFQRWIIKPNGTEGYRTAEVTLGGVDCNEISSKTMEAKKVPGLFFIGEVLDVTGWLGGYNFQWAWSSGWVAGQVV